jgi:hypothetical protein
VFDPIHNARSIAKAVAHNPLRSSWGATVLIGLSLSSASCGGGSPQAPPATSTRPNDIGESGIARFGKAASPAQVSIITGVLTSYLRALADRDGASACSKVSAAVRSELAGADPKKRRGCPGSIRMSFASESPITRRAQRRTHVETVRVEGHKAFAIYRQPDQPVAFFPLTLEGGAWKLAAIGGTLFPSP